LWVRQRVAGIKGTLIRATGGTHYRRVATRSIHGSEVPSMSSDSAIAKLPPLSWATAFATGDRKIDGEHRELLVAINDLCDLLAQGQGWSLIAEKSRRLRDRCHDHFLDEESVLEKAMYKKLEFHKKEHCLVAQQLDNVIMVITDSRIPSRTRIEAVLLLRSILVHHFFVYDLAYKAHLLKPRDRKGGSVS
jgi:hemerythrin-like metal-binding protein